MQREVRNLIYLLHVAQYILSAIEHTFSFLRIELVDKVSCVILIAVLIPITRQK